MRKIELKKAWPKDCVWPAPISEFGEYYDEDDVSWEDACEDEFLKELFGIKDKYDKLVEEGILDEDYQQIDHFGDVVRSQYLSDYFEDYWDEDNHCFDIGGWRDDVSNQMSKLKLTMQDRNWDEDHVSEIERLIGYRFVNENLLRQAFTRRAFAIEYGIKGPQQPATKLVNEGCNEELEFLGDSLLNSIVVKECFKHYATLDEDYTEAPFRCKVNEGALSKIKNTFCCKEHLAKRAKLLGLDKYILYGTGEAESEGALEDAMEALIGAVAVDSKWNMAVLEDVVDKLIDLQLDCPDELLKASYYDIFNAWHQRKFGDFPDYKVYRNRGSQKPVIYEYDCVLRYFIPENVNGLHNEQVVTATADTRTKARNKAARLAINFVRSHKLWIDLKNVNIVPNLENSINQLQELYQKRYLNSLPVYEFEEINKDLWRCSCIYESVHGFGEGTSKIKAKKAAAYMTLIRILKS